MQIVKYLEFASSVTATLRFLCYFHRRIPKSSGNVLFLGLSHISYIIRISYVIFIVVISCSVLKAGFH